MKPFKKTPAEKEKPAPVPPERACPLCGLEGVDYAHPNGNALECANKAHDPEKVGYYLKGKFVAPISRPNTVRWKP